MYPPTVIAESCLARMSRAACVSSFPSLVTTTALLVTLFVALTSRMLLCRISDSPSCTFLIAGELIYLDRDHWNKRCPHLLFLHDSSWRGPRGKKRRPRGKEQQEPTSSSLL